MRPRLFAVAIVCIALAIASPPQSSRASDASDDAHCRPYFHDACSDALGRWLPHFAIGGPDWWQQGRTTKIALRDSFARGSVARNLFNDGAAGRGTFFVYGSAGPPKGHAMYDVAHHIAFFQQGCCGWGEDVLAAGVGSPPKTVVDRNLRGVSTARGIRLWQTPAEVMRIYGASPLLEVAGKPVIRALAYSTLVAEKSLPRGANACGQFDDSYFRRGRLVLAQIWNGC